MRKLSFFACLLALAAIPLASGQTFQNQDVGGPAIEGSTEVSGNEITVTGAGNDIWNNADQFQFYYTTLVGDFDVSVQVEELEGTHQWAKAELMIRNAVSLEPQGGDPHLSMMATRADGQNQISPQWRKVRGGGSGWNGGNVVTPVPYPDVHFRMTKVGSVITGYFSEDGSDWTKMYEADTSDPDFDVIGQGGTWGNGVDFNSSPVFVGLAVTSHDVNLEATAVFSDLEFAGDVTPAVPLIEIAEQPTDAETTAGAPATFSVTTGNTFPSPTFQWTKNGTDIDGATGSSYTIDRAALADNGANFAVKITNSEGTVTSDNATLTVTADDVLPTLVSASGSGTFTTVRVVFSEPLDEASAETAGNYALSGGVTVSAAALAAEAGTAGDDTVVLTTSRQSEGTVLTLTVNNVQDAAGDNAIAAASTIDFKTHVWVNGFVLYKRWDQINTRVSGIGPHSDPDETFRELETLDAFPDNPDVVSLRPLWESVTDGDELNEYAAQISGWITPAETTGYVFFTNSDDPSHLYLSPDDDPANKLLIAQQIQWSGARQWHAGDFPLLKRSDEFGDNYPTEATDAEHEYDIWDDDDLTSSFGIPLEAGQRYYMESVHREGGGGGNVQATMITEDEAGEEGFPANGTASTLTGDLIGTYLNPNGAEVTITNQPTSVTTMENGTATFEIGATGTSVYGDSVVYQWQSAEQGGDFADIEGAISDSYTTALLSLSDSGRRYRCVVGATIPELASATSDVATLTVVNDDIPPTLASVSGHEFFTTARVVFSEFLDQASAETAANYALSDGVTVSDAALVVEAGAEGGNTVLLTTSKQPENSTLVLTVNNVKDWSDNLIAPNSTINLKTYVWQVGVAIHKRWNQIEARVSGGLPHDNPDQTFRNLETLADFPDNPDVVTQLESWEAPSGVADNYAGQISGWFVPEQTGGYVFFTNSDDPSHLYLSPDDDPANKLLIAQQIQWSGIRNWQDGNQSFKRSDEFSLNYPNEVTDPEHEYDVWPEDGFTSNGGILLEAGQRYYMEAVHREGGGGDNLEVTVITEDEAEEEGFPPNGTASTLTGDLIGAYVPPDEIELSISVRLNGDGTVTLVFTGTLHSSDSITGTFAPVEGATSPYTVSVVPGNAPPPIPGQPAPQPTPVDPQKFYLVR